MIADYMVAKKIEEVLLGREEDRTHEKSGKLSASWIYQPVLFQLYKVLGVPQKKTPSYVLGKFARGKHVESWVVEQMTAANLIVETQKQTTYRDVIGYIDAIVNSDLLSFRRGNMPHEIKSVTNAKLKRIETQGVDYHYQLQACVYALGEKTEYFAIDIVSSDDFRIKTYIFETKSVKNDVNQRIDQFLFWKNRWEKEKALPPFDVSKNVSWLANKEYWNFDPFWVEAPEKDRLQKLEALNIV